MCGNNSLKWELWGVVRDVYTHTYTLWQNLYIKVVCQVKELGLYPVVNGKSMKHLKRDLLLRKMQGPVMRLL